MRFWQCKNKYGQFVLCHVGATDRKQARLIASAYSDAKVLFEIFQPEPGQWSKEKPDAAQSSAA